MHESSRRNRFVALSTGTAAAEGPAASPPLEREKAWREYVRRIAGKDQGGLAALYDESSGLVYGLALRILNSPADAEEVAMDVYTQIWRSAVAYEESRGSVMAWVATMARTRAIDRFRSRVLQVRSEQPLSSAPRPPSHSGHEADAIRRLDGRRVQQAVLFVSPDQRRVLLLAYFSGMSHSEIAAHLQLPIGTVKTRIRLGLLKLRAVLRGEQ